jgi:hypothetical protein
MGARPPAIKGRRMIIRDPGAVAGDVLLFDDPFSNVRALRALNPEAAHWGIGICTGDVGADCADAVGTFVRYVGLGQGCSGFGPLRKTARAARAGRREAKGRPWPAGDVPEPDRAAALLGRGYKSLLWRHQHAPAGSGSPVNPRHWPADGLQRRGAVYAA